MSVEGKVVLVTGAASGIGKAIALRFAREKVKLVLADINEESLQKSRQEAIDAGSEAIAVVCNAASVSDIEMMFQKLVEAYGTIDVLVNDVGIAGPTKPVMELTAEEWDESMHINLRSQFYAIKLAAPHMIRQGSGKIVNIASMSGKKSLPNRSPYCASKMGVIGLTRCVSEELGQYNINVNAICPGPVSGERLVKVFDNMAKEQNTTPEAIGQRFFAPSHIKRASDPEDIAELALFLADDEKSRSITGQDINVNCGAITY